MNFLIKIVRIENLPLLMKDRKLYTGLRHLNKEGIFMGCPCVDTGLRFFGLIHWIAQWQIMKAYYSLSLTEKKVLFVRCLRST